MLCIFTIFICHSYVSKYDGRAREILTAIVPSVALPDDITVFEVSVDFKMIALVPWSGRVLDKLRNPQFISVPEVNIIILQ